MNKILITIFIITHFIGSIYSQNKVSNFINWTNTDSTIILNENNEPSKYQDYYIPNEIFDNATGEFSSLVYIPITDIENRMISMSKLSQQINLEVSVAYENKKPKISYSFLPYRFNAETQKIEKVESFEIVFKLQKNTKKSTDLRAYATNSLLEKGNWYKIKVDTSGIFKLTYNELLQIGLTKPENARLYSYGGKQLPYANSEYNHDDLVEIPIKIIKSDDGVFNTDDYIIFYAEGPTTWAYNETIDMFIHAKHNFTEFTYLFISDYEGAGGLKIAEIDNKNLTSTYSTQSFNNYKCYELNKKNLIKSGRTWYGEAYRPGTSKNYSFDFPNILEAETANVYTSLAGKKQQVSESCYFNISNNNTNLGNISIDDIYSTYVYAHEYSKKMEIKKPTPMLNLQYSFIGVNTAMEGYIDFICVNARETLKIQGSQFMFRDLRTVESHRITKFNVENLGEPLFVWNITNALKPYELKLTTQNNISSFNIKTDTLLQFIAFNGSNYFTPIISGEDLGMVQNQNLHGVKPHDMIIITNPLFQEQADELAELHRNLDNLSVYITQPSAIYNEFSSGTPDVSAIRNFIRMLYDKAAPGEEPKYLLLFGDGSYDNWNTGPENSNLIPTYQSINSLNELSSHVSDDYYGLLDSDEGEINDDGTLRIYGLLDAGIGRFPVQTVEEADLILDKIKNYISPKSFGSWKTNICFIGDDDEGAMHMNQPESIDRTIIKNLNPEYNVNKIYLDAYKQISTPSGQRFPDANTAIYDQVEQGALIIDYVGHGNPRILAHEEILGISEVRSWKNWDKLPIFVTASCEVGRYDDYEKTSLGEWFVLNPIGGGIAALTTTRVVFSGGNDALNQSFFRNVFNTNLRFGDVVRIAKNERSPWDTNQRNFSLLGDPALKISVPKNKITIGDVNNNLLLVPNPNKMIEGGDHQSELVYAPGDTIYALSKAKVKGYIDDADGNKLSKNGVLYITIYDKMDTLNTYGQDNDPMKFIIQNSILYKGKATIQDGSFEFEFIVPKDINYKFGKGKISLYAVLDTLEAIGYSENIVIGGNSVDSENNVVGPEIALFMNDTTFRNGDITNENPIFIAKLTDENGINTTGNGFGHNLTAVLDSNQDKIYMLNNYYEGDLDKYNSGRVRFPFSNLTPGYHLITFKGWDIYNNSSESKLEFYVHESSSTVIKDMYNAPNPFTDETWFNFEHNQAYDDSDYDAFEINIEIFDVMGNKVTQLSQKNSSPGYAISPIFWNGTNASGAKLPKGVYMYRTEITATDGEKTYKSSKLMIF